MSRRAFTLNEVLVAVLLSAVVMGVALSLAHILLRVDSALREQSRDQAGLARLAGQFRADAHAAQRFAADSRGPAPDGMVWRFVVDRRQTIEYETDGQDLIRRTVRDGNVVGQARFPLPQGTEAAMAHEPAGAATLVSLRLGPEAVRGGQSPARAIRVDAILGRDHRYSAGQED